MIVKLRKCPECKHWRFDDQSHWCNKDWLRITYTSITLPRKDEDIGECYDFEPINSSLKTKKYITRRKPVSRK